MKAERLGVNRVAARGVGEMVPSSGHGGEIMNIPPNVQYLEKPELLVWQPRGVLDQVQVDRIILYLSEQENRLGKSFDRFTDLSRIDAIDLTFKYVFQVALHRRISRLGREPIKSAFFVTSEAVERYLKLHAVLTDHSPLKVQLFGERTAAAKWLGVAPQLLVPVE
jgi:hypothetical protein